MSIQHVIRAIWHQKLNQILIGCGNGIVKAYYDDKKSFRGAMLCANKTRRKVKDVREIKNDLQVCLICCLNLDAHCCRPANHHTSRPSLVPQRQTEVAEETDGESKT